MSLTNAATKKMREYFNVTGDGFYIPDYQRDYSWGENELSDFWTDLEDSKDEEYHFFGQIVIHDDNRNKKKFIIDGQQRTITSVIFLAVLKTLFDELKIKCEKDNDEEASDIKEEADDYYTNIHGIIKKNKKCAVNLENADKDYFDKHIKQGLKFKKNEEKRKSQICIKKTYDFFYNKIKEKTASKSLAEECDIYKEYYTCLIDKFQILYVEATELEEAFDIFETLNAKGKDLEVADLLKNYFFSKLHGDNKCKEDWDYIDLMVGSDKTDYIRYFINSNGPFSSKKSLYRHIKTDIAPDERKCRKLLKDLKQYSDDFQFVSNPEFDDRYKNKELVTSLKALKIFRAKTFYPIFLAMRQRKFAENDIKNVVSKIESLIFRNIKVCGFNPNIYEKEFAKLALKIFNSHTEKNANFVCEEIVKLMEKDKDFKNRFAEFSLGQNNDELIRYIFRKIHKHLSKTNEVTINNQEVHIEHIMPRDIKKWRVSKKEHKELLWRIGNLALLDEKLNKKNSNKPFSEKKPSFIKSQIKPNKAIAVFKKWDRSSIDARQKALSEYALEIWK